jgi:hypothetical protein
MVALFSLIIGERLATQLLDDVERKDAVEPRVILASFGCPFLADWWSKAYTQ